MSGERDYSIQILGRGEDMVYRDGEGEVPLQRTYMNGHRLYCADTSGDGFGAALPFARRRRIIENLCEHFKTRSSETIFVLDVRDKDRAALQALFEGLRAAGHRIRVESDSAERRQASDDEMWLGWLRAGKTLTMDGVDIATVDDYWRWKSSAVRTARSPLPDVTDAASPKDGEATGRRSTWLPGVFLGMGGVMLAMAALLFALERYEAATIPAGRFKDPAVGSELIVPIAGLGALAMALAIATWRRKR